MPANRDEVPFDPEARSARTGRLASRLVTGVLRSFWRVRRGMTLGAQGVIVGGDNRILLVRHRYRPGWWFPGGGVERGETAEDALVRELNEEVGVRVDGPVALHGIFSNNANFPGDHIVLFVVRHWTRDSTHRHRGEIAESGMFAPGDLPAETDPGTRARMREIFDGAPVAADWSAILGR